MSPLGTAAAVILGSAGLLLLAAMVLRIRERLRHRYSASELADLSRGDDDTGWPGIRDTLPGDDELGPGGGQ